MEFRVCVLWVPGSGLGFGVQQFQIEQFLVELISGNHPIPPRVYH